MSSEKNTSQIIGCLMGGAVGDALGAPVEFMSLRQIRSEFGPSGVTEFQPAYGRKGAITDDTQMTLFTAEGLLLHQVKYRDHSIPEIVYQAYMRWLSTQEPAGTDRMVAQYGTCMIVDGILTGFRELHSARAPGNACISALKSGKMGTLQDPVNNSKGCGGVMRIAPVGLVLEADTVFDTACEVAAITHGHPTGYLAAGCLARIIHEIIAGNDLARAIDNATAILRRYPHHEECLNAIRVAMAAWKDNPVSAKTVETIGQGWIAEEALAIGLYCALAGGDDFEKAVCLAVNHGGDSDSTGSITGNIMGAMLGKDAIPDRFLAELELKDVIAEIAGDLDYR